MKMAGRDGAVIPVQRDLTHQSTKELCHREKLFMPEVKQVEYDMEGSCPTVTPAQVTSMQISKTNKQFPNLSLYPLNL